MSDHPEKSIDSLRGQFRMLRRMVLAAASEKDLDSLLKTALEESLQAGGVEAGAITLFDANNETTLSILAGEELCATRLAELEKSLLTGLRSEHQVRSVYLTIDQDGPTGVFSYPLKAGKTIYGAISGLARGERNLATEEEFISALATLMALAIERRQTSRPVSPDDPAIKKARNEAIAELTVAINHQINNPLTAISGNLQLLLNREDELPERAVRLLKKMEEGAERILEVTAKLRDLKADDTATYIGPTKMIDLDAGSNKEDKE